LKASALGGFTKRDWGAKRIDYPVNKKTQKYRSARGLVPEGHPEPTKEGGRTEKNSFAKRLQGRGGKRKGGRGHYVHRRMEGGVMSRKQGHDGRKGKEGHRVVQEGRVT